MRTYASSRGEKKGFYRKVNSRCFCWFLAAILVHHNGTPIWRLHTKLYKGAWNVSTYNSKTVGHKDLRLGKIVYIFVFHNISLSWLLPLESLYTDVYLIFLFVLFENICELSERATTSAEREKNTTPLHWRSINTLRFIFIFVKYMK